MHVICASGEAKFWLDPAVELAMSKGISAHESREMQRIIERRKEEIANAGLWLAWRDTELYLDHDRFPWFRRASVDQVFNVIEERDGHFHWPDLDVDLDVRRIQHPERYPLVAKVDM